MALNYVALQAIPLMVPSVQLAIGVPAIALNASLSGALGLTVTPPYLATALEIDAQLSAGATLGLPSVSFGVSTAATLVAQLNAAFGLLVTLEALLGASIGMYAYTYNGIASSMGGAVTSALASTWPDGVPTSGSANAMIFGAVSPIAQTQIIAFLNGLSVGSGLQYVEKMGFLSALTPVTFAALGQGNAGISALLAGALALQASLSVTPPTLAVSAAAVGKFAATAKLGPPRVGVAASLAASLNARFNLLIALGATLCRYDALLFCYTYSGAANAMGAALTSALGSTWGDGVTPTSSQCTAVILGTTDAATFTTMSGFFGGV